MNISPLKILKFHKAECGVEFQLRVGSGTEVKPLYYGRDTYSFDCFEILLFKKGRGHLILNQERINIQDNMIVFISPLQKRQWLLDTNEPLEFTFLIFKEEFLNDFFSDKLFTYKMLYFYQLVYPLYITDKKEEILDLCKLLTEIHGEIIHYNTDSEHFVRSLLYYILLKLNRLYASEYKIPLEKTNNNYAYQFKQLLETNIFSQQRIEYYANRLGISRITLNKAVQAQFNITATHLLKQRLMFEVKNELIHSESTVAEIAHKLNFSEPNHLMRFFKTQTGMTTSEFIHDYQNGSL